MAVLNTIFARLRCGISHVRVVPTLPSMALDTNKPSDRPYGTYQGEPCKDDKSLSVDKVGCFANGTNTIYMEALYDKWTENPFSVHKSWHGYFQEVMGKKDRSTAINNAACIIDFYKRWKIDPDIVEESWHEYFLNSTPSMPSDSSIDEQKVLAKEPENIDEAANSAETKEMEEIASKSLMKNNSELHSQKPVTTALASIKDTLQINGTLYDYFDAIARSDGKWMLQPTKTENNLSYIRMQALSYLRYPAKSYENKGWANKQKSRPWKCKPYSAANLIGEGPKRELQQERRTEESADIEHLQVKKELY